MAAGRHNWQKNCPQCHRRDHPGCAACSGCVPSAKGAELVTGCWTRSYQPICLFRQLRSACLPAIYHARPFVEYTSRSWTNRKVNQAGQQTGVDAWMALSRRRLCRRTRLPWSPHEYMPWAAGLAATRHPTRAKIYSTFCSPQPVLEHVMIDNADSRQHDVHIRCIACLMPERSFGDLKQLDTEVHHCHLVKGT